MKIHQRLSEWLESRYCAPAYGGWVLIAIALCFFGAATNTMAGWLYVISGIILALLVLGAVLPVRSLSHLNIRRFPIEPVSAGHELTIELVLENLTSQPKTLFQAQELLPFALSRPKPTAIAAIPAQETFIWSYSITARRRGIYQWHEVQLRTGAPLGLFWCRRCWQVPARAVVYPKILPLKHCSLIEAIGNSPSTPKRYQAATEGLTKGLRPYRHGDSIRLVAWRRSARFDQLQVRELEVMTGGQEVAICLDCQSPWQADAFEQAVIAAASLYCYASRRQANAKLWTADSGLLQGDRAVLETLAAAAPTPEAIASIPAAPLVWLTSSVASLHSLPAGSQGVLFPSSPRLEPLPCPTLVIDSGQPLQQQLQQELEARV
ncbi:MAG: DUF58 domain-containing protein [Cyanophyceae cyanobacterium]